jgi:WD40 repeat protein
MIDIVDVQHGYKHMRSLQGHALPVTHIDWHAASKDSGSGWLLQSGAGLRELKHWRVVLKSDSSARHANVMYMDGEDVHAEAVRDAVWETWTLPVGWHVQGITQDVPVDDTRAKMQVQGSKRALQTVQTGVRALWRDGDLVIVGVHSKMRVFRWPCFTPTARFKEYMAHVSQISAVAMRAQEGHVVSCATSDGAVLHWRLTHLNDSGARGQQASAPGASGSSNQQDTAGSRTEESAARNVSGFVTFSSDASRLCAITGDTEAAVFSIDWQLAQVSQDCLYKLHKYAVNSCCFAPSGDTVCTVSQDTDAHVWHTRGTDADRKEKRVMLRGHERDVVGVAYAPDGQTVATASLDRTLRYGWINVCVHVHTYSCML